MSLSTPTIDVRKQRTTRTRLARFSLIALLALLLSVTACGGMRRDSQPATRTGTVSDYHTMIQEYDQQAGPPDEGFWNEVYQDAK